MSRRIRVAECPHCKKTVPLDKKKSEHGDKVCWSLTICQNCFAVFDNNKVESRLIHLEELCRI